MNNGHQKVIEGMILAGLGFSNRFIQARTGLSRGKLGYWASVYNIKRKYYRDGKSAAAKLVLRTTKPSVQKMIENQIQKMLTT